MQKSTITLFLIVFTVIQLQGAMSRAPEDFMGRVPIPAGVEVEVLKFKTDQIVYAGTNGAGLYVSYNGGTNWAKLTEFPEEFQCIKDIIIAPNKDLYVATFGGGVYYSSDNGANWIPKNTGLKNLYVQALTVTNLGKVVCGTYGGGIYYSDDKGDNWTRTDKGLRNDNVTCLLAMRNGRILAGTAGGGVYASRDTCKSWIMSNTELKNYFLNDFSEDESGKIYAATNGGGVMFSGDGMSWNTYPNTFHYIQEADIFPLIDTAVVTVGVNKYQMLMGTRSAGMYFWDEIWNCWQNTGEFALGITACAVSPNGTILATRTLGDVTRSTDNGEHWTICAKKITDVDLSQSGGKLDYLNVFISDFDNSLISISKLGDTRSVYKSVNHGNNWKYLGTFNSKKVNALDITPEGNLFIATTEGIIGSFDKGQTFPILCKPTDRNENYWEFNYIEYDSLSKSLVALWSYFEPDTVPPIGAPTESFRIYRSIDNGATWTFNDNGTTHLGSLHYDNMGTWYLQLADNYVKSVNQCNTFTTLFKAPPGLLIYGKDGNQYYHDNTNNIYYSKDFSPNFKKIPFTPEIFVTSNFWNIQQMFTDIYGRLYVAIQISTPMQGILYELYMSPDLGQNWQTMKGCYNMDQIRDIKSDNDGYTYVWTNALYKTLHPEALEIPVILAPKDGLKGEEINPLMIWNQVPLAEEYELQFDQLEDFPAPFEVNVTGDTTCKVVLNLFYGSDFYWRMRSKTHSARSEWSETHSFTIGLEPPVLISPEKGKAGVPLIADLKWHKMEDATYHLVQVAEDENFDKIIFEQTDFTDTTIRTNKLSGTKTYYWRVKAYTKDNASRYSEVWNFRTIMGPPNLIYPENESIDKQLTEQFKWNKSTEAQTYVIQVANDSEFTDLFFDGSAGADTFKIIDNMLAEMDYYWHVASVNDDGTSDYSETWTFRTSLKAVELIYPENQKVNVAPDAKFTWTEHIAGSQFQIQISKDADFKTPIVDQKVSNVLEFQTNKLEYYKNYFWRVRLVVGQRFGLWSNVWAFKTGIQTANLLNPPDKSIDQSTTIKFRWYEVLGAKFYQLQISKNEQFTDMVYSMDSLSKFEQFVEKLEPEILYYWRVRAWNDESYGTAQWSNVWTFTTGKVTLVLRNPKSGTTGVNIPTLLTWFAATTAEYYNLQVAKDEAFANVIFDKDSIFDTKWTLLQTDVLVNTDYFWRVRGIGKQYTTPWSETWNFTTAATSIKESELFSSISIYPNPTGKKADLIINYAENCTAEILISSMDGKIVKTDAIRLLPGETRYEIETEKLTSGSYFITIITPDGYITKELVVVK